MKPAEAYAKKRIEQVKQQNNRLVSMIMYPECFAREELKEAYTESFLEANPDFGKFAQRVSQSSYET